MNYSNVCLFFGFMLIIIGLLLIFKSVIAHPIEFKSSGAGIIFLGPFPIVITGGRKWTITALGIFGFILVFVFLLNWRNSLMSW